MDNYTFIRLLNYPPVVMTTGDKCRCAEHIDYGTFSLLFQDKGGGLQVCNNIPLTNDTIHIVRKLCH